MHSTGRLSPRAAGHTWHVSTGEVGGGRRPREVRRSPVSSGGRLCRTYVEKSEVVTMKSGTTTEVIQYFGCRVTRILMMRREYVR